MNSSRFMTATLKAAPWGDRVARVLSAALEAVDPAAAVKRHMRRERDSLIIAGKRYNLGDFRRALLVGAGKAGAPMAQAVCEILGKPSNLAKVLKPSQCSPLEGFVIVKEGYAGPIQGTTSPGGPAILEAGHPLPDARGVTGARRIAELLATTQADDLVIGLISGGASALLVLPVEGVTLDDMQGMTTALLASGANIHEINTLRKHLERLKGGQLARLAGPAQVAALILSDVIGDPLEIIGSGPTVPDSSTFEDAYQVLERHQIKDKVPNAILEHLNHGQRGEVSETPKPGDPTFDRVFNVIIGSNRLAADAALAQAQAEGFNTLLLTTFLQGEARQVGPILAAIARQVAASGQPVPRPACLVFGGETTVTLRGDGLGGRNQEMALAAVEPLAGIQGVALVTLATDGGDGPTDAAGAVVTGETLGHARQAGLDPTEYLAHSDSYHFFEPLGDLLKPGPTQTNVNDLSFVFAF